MSAKVSEVRTDLTDVAEAWEHGMVLARDFIGEAGMLGYGLVIVGRDGTFYTDFNEAGPITNLAVVGSLEDLKRHILDRTTMSFDGGGERA